MLPRRFRLDARGEFFVVDKAVEEVVPGFRRTARIGEHLVTGRLLPRRFRLDASDDFFVVDEAVEEVVPGF
ncbi:hypothetical protein, partial [Sinorhizobium meliloti]|uniref:hypothetical protein n=1 Tax=Rhizobium meliloti TaxID=382 RepID=UPI001AEC7EB9